MALQVPFKQSVPRVESVGRQRVDAPVEAFGGGAAAAGLAGAGRAAQSIGQQVERDANRRQREEELKRQESERLKRRDESFKADRAMLNYRNQMNGYVVENKDRPDIEQNSEDYRAFSERAKKEAMNSIIDPEVSKALSLSIDKSESSYKNMMRNRAVQIRQAEEKAVRNRNFAAAEDKLLVASDELERDFDIQAWFDRHGDDYRRTLEVNSLAIPEGEREGFKKDHLANTFGKIFNKMGNTIASHPNPTKYTELVNSLVDGGQEAGVFSSEQADQLKSTNNKRLKSRAVEDENRRVAAQSEWVNDNRSAIIQLQDNPIARQLVIDNASTQAKLFGTNKDKNGQQALKKIKDLNRSYEAKQQNSNELDVELELLINGPAAAQVKLDQMIATNKVNIGGKDVIVQNLNKDQFERLTGSIERGYDSALKSVFTDFAKELKDLSESGKLYSATLEAGAREFEPLDLKAGKSVSTFDLIVPFASDWDQNQVDGEDLVALLDNVRDWADKNNITDGARLRQYTRELLFPVKQNAARKTFRMRMRLEN
jgi:hypothetical protein